MADSGIASTYEDDDWLDLDKYKQAAGVAYEFSKKKSKLSPANPHSFHRSNHSRNKTKT